MLRPVDPFVAVFAVSPRRQMLVTRLRENGLDGFYAAESSAHCGARVEAVLVDLELDAADAMNLQTAFPSSLIVLTPAAKVPESVDAIRLRGLEDLPWLRSHLLLDRRRRIRREEHELRLATRRTFGLQDPAILRTPRHIVFGGAPSPRLLGLQSELRRLSVRLTPCLTPATFLDRIESLPLSAVVFDGAANSSFARAWAARESLPAPDGRLTVISIGTREGGGHDIPGIDHFIESSLPVAELARSIVREIECCAGQADTRIEPTHTDPSSGLPTRAYFERHLEHQMEFARAASLPHALLTFRLQTDAQSGRQPLRAFCETLVRFARAEDFCAKIDWQTVSISIRGADFRDGNATGERLSRALKHHHPEITHIWRVVEMRHHHDAAALISASLPSAAERFLQVRSA